MKSVLNYSQIVLLVSLLFYTTALDANKIDFLKPGLKAPHMTLISTNDKSYTFPSSGSWNLIAYWSLFCHSCIDEMPMLQKELNKSKFKNLKSYFVSLDSVRMKRGLINFLIKRKLSTTVLMEEIASKTYVTADKWGVTITPSLFIVSPNGVIEYSQEGPADMDAMLSKLEQLMANASATIKTQNYDK